MSQIPDYKALTSEISANLVPLSADLSPVLKAFHELGKAATSAGALDAKTKELIALAIGVAVHCDGCIGFHTKALVKLGASKAEIEETLGMAVYMGGGPSLMYASNAMAAYAQFSA